MTPKKCNHSQRAESPFEIEVGCPLDHCLCGTHDADNEHHECKPTEDDVGPYDDLFYGGP